MTTSTAKMTFDVIARRLVAHGSQVDCKGAHITLDTDLAGTKRRKSAPTSGAAALSGDLL